MCTNCQCEIKLRNATEEIKAVETPIEETPAEGEIIEGFDYHDLVGVALPEILTRDFEEERVNVHVYIDEKTEYSTLGGYKFFML